MTQLRLYTVLYSTVLCLGIFESQVDLWGSVIHVLGEGLSGGDYPSPLLFYKFIHINLIPVYLKILSAISWDTLILRPVQRIAPFDTLKINLNDSTSVCVCDSTDDAINAA